jgi:hypothetical protein
MKLAKLQAKEIDIEFNGEVKSLVVDFESIRAIGTECGNLTALIMHVVNAASGREMPDAVQLATFYTAIVNRAGFTFERKRIQVDMVYAALMADYAEVLPEIVRSCATAAMLMIPGVGSDEPAEDAPKKKTVTRKPATR